MSKKRIAKLRAKLKAAEERAEFFHGEVLRLDPHYHTKLFLDFTMMDPRANAFITNLQPPAPEVEK